MRLNDVVLNEGHPTDQDNPIILQDLTIVLDIFNVAFFFHGRTPTRKEYDECERIELTYPSPEWSPNSDLYTEEESKCLDKKGYARKLKGTRRTSSIIHDDGEFIRCINALAISQDDKQSVSGINSEKFKLNSIVLCTNWGIHKNIAENTIKETTHPRVQTVNHPNVERRWPTGDRPLRYRRLDHAV
jgi:hypothetical protein